MTDFSADIHHASDSVPNHPHPWPRSGALSSVEKLLMDSGTAARLFEVRYCYSPDLEPMLSVHGIDDGSPLSRASVQLDEATGRFYRTYLTGWSGRGRKEERHYFADVHDAAGYLRFLLTPEC